MVVSSRQNFCKGVRMTQYTMNLPWFESPFYSSLLEEKQFDATTQERVQKFAEDGYFIMDLSSPSFNQQVDDIVDHLKNDYAEGKERIQDAWVYNSSVKELALHPEVLSILEVLYERRPVPFQTLNFHKGTQQATHSDALHFHSVPERFMCGVWIALEDVDENNGPLHYYPKSHKLPFYDLHDIGYSSEVYDVKEAYSEYTKFLQNLVKAEGLEKINVKMKKGQALVWASNLLHGGSPILDPSRSRHSQVTHYYFSNCRYYTPMFSDPFNGRMKWREIVDISTGQNAPQHYNGKRVKTCYKTRLKQMINQAMMKTPLFRRKKIQGYQALK